MCKQERLRVGNNNTGEKVLGFYESAGGGKERGDQDKLFRTEAIRSKYAIENMNQQRVRRGAMLENLSRQGYD